jgi:hypothetical protein
MEKLIFLLEEASMKAFLEGFLPRLLPTLDFLCLHHEGKQDLEKSIPRKLKAWQDAIFVVVRDNDNADCLVIKERLRHLCQQNGRTDVLIRIACQELEAWFLGVPEILAEVYYRPKLGLLGRKAKFRNPDLLGSPSLELTKLVPEFKKMEGAHRMGAVMPTAESENRSKSFQVFVQGLHRLVRSEAEKVYTPPQ